MSEYYRPLPSIDPNGLSWLSRARQWDIEYGGYLSNHIAHNWIVMAAVGEPPERFAWWESLYNLHEESLPAREPGPLVPARRADHLPVITVDNWHAHLQSSRVLFPAYQAFFDDEIRTHGQSQVLKTYFPVLSEGMVGAAFHAVIHTGFGVDIGHDDTVSDGLAYMATAFQPLGTRAPHRPPPELWTRSADHTVVSSSERFLTQARDYRLFQIAHTASLTPEYVSLERGAFQPRILAFDDAALPLATALNAACPLGLPGPKSDLTPTVETCMALLAIALRESNNEFFILHGLTSLHATLSILPHIAPEAQRDALTYWWRALMATLVAQDLPALDATLELLTRWSHDGSTPAAPVDDAWWLGLIRHSFESLDEHIPKALYALWRWSSWHGFSQRSHQLFQQAARHLMKPYPPGALHTNLWSNSFTEAGDAVRTSHRTIQNPVASQC